MRYLFGGLALMATLIAPLSAQALDKVHFGINWVAEAEYGGFYQAVATGIYAKHGLEVTIKQGGPQVNQAQLLLSGRLDLNIASNSFQAMNFVKENLPFRAVAAMYQKSPSVLIAHPGQGNDDFASLKGKPILISGETRVGWWNFLKAKFAYTDNQIRPYTFNLAPFLADKKAVQQGLLGSEPFSIQEATGEAPVVMLVADAGFTGYGSLITASDKTIQERGDVVQRFLDASFEGWYSYLYGDPARGDALIRKENPEMPQNLIDYSRESLKKHAILDSGDAIENGIGAMSPERWKAFYEQTQAEGLYQPDLDPSKAYTLQFVNKGVGIGAKR